MLPKAFVQYKNVVAPEKADVLLHSRLPKPVDKGFKFLSPRDGPYGDIPQNQATFVTNSLF